MIDYIIIIVISIILSILLSIIFEINIKKIKEIGERKDLNELAKKYPENITICKKILKMLNNEKVKVEENKNAENCLYIAILDKITIGNTNESYTRIQTIAHECLHSIQDRKLQLFNFIFSNIYLIYFVLSIILIVLKIKSNKLIFILVFLILGLIYYVVRIYLENDAMIKARFLAEKYMKKEQIMQDTDNQKLLDGFDELNNVGIKYVNCSLALGILIKVIILSILALIF